VATASSFDEAVDRSTAPFSPGHLRSSFAILSKLRPCVIIALHHVSAERASCTDVADSPSWLKALATLLGTLDMSECTSGVTAVEGSTACRSLRPLMSVSPTLLLD
jgi:hypothetical protein